MNVDNRLSNTLAHLPDSPGIYLFYTEAKELVYVGKATSLRNRVQSYFRGPRTIRPIEQLIHEVVHIDWRPTDSVLEAIILEAEYIKKYQPKYNVDGKDDKSWNYIVITKDEYPRVETLRQHDYIRITNDTNLRIPKKKQFSNLTIKQFKYIFGPYPGLNTPATMKILRRLFHFSTCQPGQKRPCLYYEMGECLGVCTREISPRDYRAKVIRPLVTFLHGRKKQLIKQLEINMRKAAKAEDFEEAARLRNQIGSLQRIQDIALLNKSFTEDPIKTSDSTFQASRIEGYDISNLGPTGVVGSMVVFGHGEPDKSQYRKFKIRGFSGQNDVDALAEVLTRRLKHTEWPYPDLFVIDGGKPQLNRVKQVLVAQHVSIPIVGIAKGPERKRNDIFFGEKNRALIAWAAANQKILIAVRDEAHRFAITYQRKTRELK